MSASSSPSTTTATGSPTTSFGDAATRAARPRPRAADEPADVRRAWRPNGGASATGSSASTCSATASPTRPAELNFYAMPAFADQIAALLDHLEIEQAVVGGTSLGANVALEFGVAHPDRAQGLFVEMPVLDNALVAVAIAFTPVLVGAQLGAPLLGARRRPRPPDPAQPLPRRHRPRLGRAATRAARPASSRACCSAAPARRAPSASGSRCRR